MMRSSASRERGFTLTEVMIVVVILSVLVTLATFGVRRYIRSAKTAEATQIIGTIKAGQEAYFDETFRYCDVSEGNLDTGSYPDETSDMSVKVQWDPGSNRGKLFASIGVAPAAPVQYRYSTIAGIPGDPTPNFGKGDVTAADYNFPSTTTAPWYLVKAIGDLDDDGGGSCSGDTCGVFFASNFTNEIYSKNADE